MGSPLSQQQLDLPQAQAEHVVEPDHVVDDLTREAVATRRVGWLAHAVDLQRPLIFDQTLLT